MNKETEAFEAWALLITKIRQALKQYESEVGS